MENAKIILFEADVILTTSKTSTTSFILWNIERRLDYIIHSTKYDQKLKKKKTLHS